MLCSQKDTLRKSFFLLTKRLLTKRDLTSIQHKILWKPSKNWDKTLKNFLHFLNYALQDAKAVKNTWEKDTSVQKNHRKRHFCFYQIKISHFCPSKDTSVYQKSLLSLKSHFCSYRTISLPENQKCIRNRHFCFTKSHFYSQKKRLRNFPHKRWSEWKFFYLSKSYNSIH